MKVYRVVTERDGETTKEGGRSSTEILREDWRYAAERIEDVWDAIADLRADPERTVIAIIEEAPAIFVVESGNDLPKDR